MTEFTSATTPGAKSAGELVVILCDDGRQLGNRGRIEERSDR